MTDFQVISTKELRDNLAEILEKVAIAKQSFIVAKFGKQKALINPLPQVKTSQKVDLEKLAAFGMWQNRKDLKNSAKWVSDLRKKESSRVR